ncbi:MAG: hypothetical protein Q4B43_08195 [Bacteroidota bacterium]|nr:hypothetical protein [Bacteroidota bacterium]
MRKVLFVFVIVASFVFQGCIGPAGPPGPPGSSVVSAVRDVTVSFSPSNGFNVTVPLPQQLYNSDVVIAYEMSGIDGGNPIWKSLPSTYYVNGGEVRYFYDYTRNDIAFYLDTDLPPQAVPIQYVANKTFRIVILPAHLLSDVDVTNFDNLLEKINQ